MSSTASHRFSSLSLLAGAGVAQSILCLYAAAAGDACAAGSVMWWLLAASVVPLGLAALAARGAPPPAASVIVVLAGAVAMRLALLPWHPALSDDFYRYLWDGRVLASGGNPYGRAPNDPALTFLRDAWWAGINHKTMPTIYPPLAIATAALARVAGDGVTPLKAAFILLDIGVVAILIRLLHRQGSSPAWAALYAWHPMVVTEVAGSVHLEPLAVLPLLAAVVALTPPAGSRGEGKFFPPNGTTVGALVGLSIIGKLGGVLLLPAVARRCGRRAVWACAAVVALATLPFVWAGPRMFASLVTYAQSWEFNGSVFDLCATVLRHHGVARVVVAAALVVIVLRSRRSRAPLAEVAFVVFTAAFLLAPTVYPWYLLWPLPFAVATLARTQRPAAWAVVVWGMTSMLSYVVLGPYRRTGLWHLPWWAQVAEYAPVVALLAADASLRADLRRVLADARGWRTRPLGVRA